MTRDGLTEENLRDGSVKDISHRSRGRPENKEEFVPERERKKTEGEDSKSGKVNDCKWKRSGNLLSGRKLLRIQLESHRKKKYPDIERNCIVMKKSQMMITI